MPGSLSGMTMAPTVVVFFVRGMPFVAGADRGRVQAFLMFSTLWCLVGVVTATLNSRRIYGLRKRIRAMGRLGQYTLAEKTATFGRFDYEPDPSRFEGDGIRILGTWEADNIVNVPVPQLVGKLFGGRPMTQGILRFHRLGQQALANLWRDWEAAGLLDRVVSFQGGYAARFIRGSAGRNPRPLSNHAWGPAFDINAEWNAFRAEPALLGQTGCVRELVEIANRNGFYWGGHFNTARDGRHFELAMRV